MNYTEITLKFHLSEDSKASLEKYYLLKWKGDYLQTQISEVGLIKHQSIDYLALLTKSDPIDTECQYKLSFRKPKDGSTGIVLIKKVYPK